MTVTEGDEGEALPLAPDEQLYGINIAAPIAYTGFPMENIANLSGAPAMRADLGTVAAVTTVYFQAGDPRECRIIHYNLVTAGGASGSPVLNEFGNVIALNSAGDYIHNVVQAVAAKAGEGGKTTSEPIRVGIGFKYGQRVDMLRELMDGSADRLQPAREAEWRRIASSGKDTNTRK
jgi:hypothetical protein